MKKKRINILAVAFLALLIIFASAFLVRHYLQKTSDQLISMLDEIDGFVDKGSWDEAYAKMNDIDEAWEKKEKVWGMVINHHEIDNISISLKSALIYIDLNDEVDSLASLASLRHYIGHIPIMERMSLKNII